MGTQHLNYHLFSSFWLHFTCMTLVPRPGIEPTPPALEGGVNHWITREVLICHLLPTTKELSSVTSIQT